MILSLIFRSLKCLTERCVSDSYSTCGLVSKPVPISKITEIEAKSSRGLFRVAKHVIIHINDLKCSVLETQGHMCF